jgi:hypothetical protein
MHTVRIRRGEFAVQLPQGPEEKPDYVMRNISEVRKLPFAWGDTKSHHGGTETRRKQNN